MSEENHKGLHIMDGKTKRDIFRFTGSEPKAINLDHVACITLKGTFLTFTFYACELKIDLQNEETANTIYEQVIKAWADVVE